MKVYSTSIVEHVLTVQNEIGEAPIWSSEGKIYPICI